MWMISNPIEKYLVHQRGISGVTRFRRCDDSLVATQNCLKLGVCPQNVMLSLCVKFCLADAGQLSSMLNEQNCTVL